MKGFVLDSTYKESIIIDMNDTISIISSHNLPNNPVYHYSTNLNQITSNYIAHHNKNDKFNTYNIIDYL
ncbi:hypothetical protein [Clostridium saccharobutylicum]|uniref:Uncharacterized protein n=1 Tax=Clostridium saccharobutylicum TaxID=169679 RepID=A0A1S8N3Y1_CLOSA|nr:hypothetical protein [Clostridium saccharobutylicum]OOM11130.1 hypothetical protein CLOSAC_26730 [Clostridium saccharobutylicum]